MWNILSSLTNNLRHLRFLFVPESIAKGSSVRSPWTSYTEPSCTEPSYIEPSYIEPITQSQLAQSQDT